MKHLSAILVFILAVMLQLWFAPAGMRGDFVLATLVVFAFLFEFLGTGHFRPFRDFPSAFFAVSGPCHVLFGRHSARRIFHAPPFFA